MLSYPLNGFSSGFLSLSWTRFPILFFLASVNDQSVYIKWVDDSLEPMSGIVIARALDLCDTVFSKINFV